MDFGLTSSAISLFRQYCMMCLGKYPAGTSERALQDTYYTSEPTGLKQVRLVYMSDDRWLRRGLTDRLRGILEMYYYAKRYDIPFYINWTEPFYLTDFLVPADYDWRISPDELSYTRATFPLCIESRSSWGKAKRMADKMIIDSILRRKSREVHVYTNIGYHHDSFRELFNELFKPSERLKEELSKYQFRYWSYSFRFMQLLGDFTDSFGRVLDESEREALINRNLDELRELLKDLPEGYKALVTTDSATFLKRAEALDPRIFVIPGNIIHPCTASSTQTKSDEFLKTFVDMFLIMNAEKVYRLKTGEMYGSQFPKFAANVGGKDYVDWRF